MPRLSTIRQVIGLAGWLLLSFAAAGVGAVASLSAGIFYQQLLRPEWAPPPWFFGPLWSVLYLLMGIAAWLVWRQRGFRESGMALWLFIAQLTANALWSWLFFSWHNGAWAFYEILILLVLLLCTVGRVLARAQLGWCSAAALSGMGDICHRLVLRHGD